MARPFRKTRSVAHRLVFEQESPIAGDDLVAVEQSSRKLLQGKHQSPHQRHSRPDSPERDLDKRTRADAARHGP